ncbi:MAG TPA: DinB family protein [Puia sp.]|nr:DinB family protein [Puia sp.]
MSTIIETSTVIRDLLKEMDQEAITSRKMLALIPTEYFSWKPHPKSMTIQHLATHIAELPGWVTMALITDGLDFSNNPYKQEVVNDTEELLAYFDRTLADGRAHLAEANEKLLSESWVLRNGDQICQEMTKAETVRVAYCQTVHHRAQLGVFLRLLDIPIPGSYGPSADEMEAAA